LKLELFKIPLAPDQYIAPPSPVIVPLTNLMLFKTTFAELTVNTLVFLNASKTDPLPLIVIFLLINIPVLTNGKSNPV